VKFTLELITNPDFRAWRTTGHSLVRDIAVASPTEITWRMEEAFAPYLSFLTETFIVPKHILEKEADPNAAAFNQAPVGTGAFKWGQRVAGNHLELVANPDYFGEGPYIERLIFKYIPDLTVLYTQFKTGALDVTGMQGISAEFYEEAGKLPGVTIHLHYSPSVEYIYFNHGKPWFKERAVRQALYHAMDKRAIIEQVYYGLPKPVVGVQRRAAEARAQSREGQADPGRGRLEAGRRRHPGQGRRPAELHQLHDGGQQAP
jgi:peptide/nickel transport system substrate-binding protein